MVIAEQKKQNNIVEYIIHIYQSEDLIRAFDCDLEKVNEYVLKHIPNEVDKSEMKQWYANLLSQMKEDKVLTSGHIKSIQNEVENIEQLKEQLLQDDTEFKRIYDKAYPQIKGMLELASGKISSEIQICINGVYGMLLAKINGREIPEDVQPAIEEFGNVLSYLSYKYKQYEFMNKN